MPSINKFRVSNVKFMENKRYYDDLVICANEGNLLFEGTNGDGKTLYMQCVTQCIKPNSYFRTSNRMRRLFAENNNGVIHSMIEWALDEGSEYQYLITGFCAKSTKNEAENTGELFKYFNYAIMYNADAPISVESIPLRRVEEDGKVSRMSWSELRNYIRRLNENEDRCVAQVFDSKKEYTAFLENYNIDSIEWELLLRINFEEGGSETYLSNTYPTAKSFIQGELIPIIESVDRKLQGSDYSGTKELAETLIDIKRGITEYSHKRSKIGELSILEDCFNDIVRLNNKREEILKEQNNTFKEVIKGYNKHQQDMSDVMSTIEQLEEAHNQKEKACEIISEKITQNKENIKENEQFRDKLNNELDEIRKKEEILKNRKEKKDILSRVEGYIEIIKEKNEVLLRLCSKRDEIESMIVKVDDEILEKEMENVYLEYRDADLKVKEAEKSISLSTKSNEEIFNQEKQAQSKLLYLLNSVKKKIDIEIEKVDNECTVISNNIEDHNKKLNEHLITIGSNERKLKELKEDVVTINANVTYLKNEVNQLGLDKENVLESAKTAVDTIEKIEGYEWLLDNTEDYNNAISTLRTGINESELSEDITEKIATLNNEVVKSEDIIRTLKEQYKEDRLALENDLEISKQESEKKINNIKSQIRENESNIIKCETEITNIKNGIISSNTSINNFMNELDEYFDALAEIEELLEKVKLDDRFKAENLLDKEVSDIRNEIFGIEKEIEELDYKISSMKMNQGVTLPKESRECYEVLSNAYNSAILGMDFINSLSDEEKYKYLEKTTVMQWGVLLSGNEYNHLKSNKNLREKISDYRIPIFNIDMLKEVDVLDESVFFVCSKDKEFFLNADRLKLEIEQLEKKIEKLIKNKEVLNEGLEEKNAALKLLIGVNSTYNAEFYDDIKENIRCLEKEVSDSEKDLEKERELLTELKNLDKSLKVEIENINKVLESLYSKTKTSVNDINSKLDKYDELSSNFSNVRLKIESISSYVDKYFEYISSIEKLKFLIEDNNKDLGNTQAQIKVISKENELLKEEVTKEEIILEDCKHSKKALEEKNIKNRTERTSIIDQIENRELIPLGTKEIECSVSIDEVKNELKVLGKKIKDVNSTIQIYKENLESFKNIRQDKLSKIERSKISLESLVAKGDYIRKNSYEDFAILEDRKNALINNKNIENNKINTEKFEINSVEAKKNLELERANEINTYEDVLIEDGYDPQRERVNVNSKIEDIKSKLEHLRSLDDEFITQLNQLNKESSSISKDISDKKLHLGTLESQKIKIEILINTHDINKNITDEKADSTEFVIKEASKKLKRVVQNVEENDYKQLYVKERGLNELSKSAFDIVQVLKEIKTPKSIDEIAIQNNSILSENGFLNGIATMRDSIEGEIKSFQELKENFVLKCINKTDSLISKLHELSKYSTVFIEEKKIPLLKIHLHELNQEQKVEKMTNHIYNLMDKMDIVDDKEALIAEGLSSKVLLEQCVRNMNNCEVEMYVPGNVNVVDGYYEKWAGGASGGQRNVIYLTVVIALIVFIRELGTVEKKGKNVKVLYADGPFKASQSVYLWECLMLLMKENNIQFIVTNYKTTPALLNLFDSIAQMIGYNKIIGGKACVENRLSMESVFKEDVRSLKGENILHNFGEYRIPRKNAIKQEYTKQDTTLFDLMSYE